MTRVMSTGAPSNARTAVFQVRFRECMTAGSGSLQPLAARIGPKGVPEHSMSVYEAWLKAPPRAVLFMRTATRSLTEEQSSNSRS